ncbi:MAG: CDP-glycerol glycerophosphotransferase family protein [Leptospiraceae bacterium]|nr:CDP-glycerol glycerophosphotransferase family protein [Leptospiraceae bacterium]MBP9887403.1 CDP-glycerol glycerophosphotransferase family protein [Leptospiraceae bacterium]
MQLKGNGLFVYSDPAGAKAVLALALEIQSDLSRINIVSDREYDFVSDFKFLVKKPALKIEEDFEKNQPSFLFTGTSYTSQIELKYISFAQKKKIPTYSFIDHWTSFKERFSIDNILVFPDKILVIDDRAKSIAVLEGLPEEKIIVFGNPYYNYLKKWTPKISKENFLKSIGVNDDSSKIVVFAPEPLSNVDGIAKYGFDEVTTLNEIKGILDQNEFSYHFIFKPHPNQKMERIENSISKKMIVIDVNVDTNTLIYYSDVIISFFSNILIEAATMNKRILRYHKIPVNDDPISELKIGKIVDKNGFLHELM